MPFAVSAFSAARLRPLTATRAPRVRVPPHAVGMPARQALSQPRLPPQCAQQHSGPTAHLVAQGQALLQALRNFSFGGRLAGEAQTKLELLQAYYPSLRTLCDLSRISDMAQGARNFLLQVSLPKDLQSWLAKALEIDWPAQASRNETETNEGSRRGAQLPSAPCGTGTLCAKDVVLYNDYASWFKADDAGLDLLVARYGSFARLFEHLRGQLQDRNLLAAALRAYDRAVFLGLEPNPRQGLRGVRTSLPKLEAGDPVAMLLARLIARTGLDSTDVNFSFGDNLACERILAQALEAVERVSLGVGASVPPAAHNPAERPRVQSQWQVIVALPPAEVSERAQRLVHWLNHAPAGEALAALDLQHGAPAWQRLDWEALPAVTRTQLGAALLASDHPGYTLVLAALLLQGGESELRPLWQERGYGTPQIDGWLQQLHALQQLPAAQLRGVLADALAPQPQLASLPLRLHLAQYPAVDTAAVQAAYDQRDVLDDVAALGCLVEHAADATRVAALQAWLQGPKAPPRAVQNQACTQYGFAAFWPQSAQALHEAVEVCRQAGGSHAANQALIKTLRDLNPRVPTHLLVHAALQALYAHDMARVLPLNEVDASVKQARRGRVSADSVDVAGVQMPLNQDASKDRRAVPRKQEADLVMTPTTETNLWRIATMARAGQAVLLEGPTSAGKTSAVRYLAYKTNNPLRRITLSFRTEVGDLIGRMVPGEARYKASDLDALTQPQIDALARTYGADLSCDRASQQADILKKQKVPRWVDGLVVQAVRRGEWLILDEINLAQPEVIERLNSLLDDDQNITLESGEKISAHKNFRVFATMNPGNYVGRGQLSDALRSRWARVFCQGLSRADLSQILKVRFADSVPAEEMRKLLVVHSLLAEAADKGSVARNLGGISYSLRNLRNVCERFVAYRGGGLSDAALMRRETEEVYRAGLPPTDAQMVDDVLTAAMPYSGPGFYDDLQLTVHADSVSVGDVTLPCVGARAAVTRAQLVPTPRTVQLLYRLAKIIDRGENALLIGGKASGKTSLVAMLAELLGQAYQRQMIGPATDTMQLVGSYTTQGWQDGVILQGGRPENTPAITLLDEINFGDSATLERLNGAFEKDDRTVVITEGDGSVVRLHPQSHVMGAMNPPGEKYGGRKRLSKALQNRMTAVYVSELTETSELRLIVQGMAARKIADPQTARVVADALLEMHTKIATAYEKGQLGQGLLGTDKPVLSIRSLLRALDVTVELMRDMSVGQAFVQAMEVSYASEATQADNAAIMEEARLVAA